MSEGNAVRIDVVGLDALEVCHDIRRVVFVREQQVPEALEIDGLDGEAVHFLATSGPDAIATARLRSVDGAAKAERVAVLAAHRGTGVGAAIMTALEERARADGHREIVLHAQRVAIPFYRKLGYEEEGELFLDAGIVHRSMRKQLA